IVLCLILFLLIRVPPSSTLFPYTTLFRSTARTLTRILISVVEAGTGHNAAIPGYAVAGKTGTAQKLDPATHRYSRAPGVLTGAGDRKSTRLNSSHDQISYAVFCLKKKKKT